jgi:hypothetical protein
MNRKRGHWKACFGVWRWWNMKKNQEARNGRREGAFFNFLIGWTASGLYVNTKSWWKETTGYQQAASPAEKIHISISSYFLCVSSLEAHSYSWQYRNLLFVSILLKASARSVVEFRPKQTTCSQKERTSCEHHSFYFRERKGEEDKCSACAAPRKMDEYLLFWICSNPSCVPIEASAKEKGDFRTTLM